MNRRLFIAYAASLVPVVHGTLWAKHQGPEIAFTFDDPKTDGGAGLSWQEINERLLKTLAKHRIKCVLFVAGKRVDSDVGRNLIASWDEAGHDIGNHSYSHLFFNNPKISLAEFEADFSRNEPLIRRYRHFVRLFRYPYFKEGDTADKRDGMRSFLRLQGYRIGRATIDTSDWAISVRLENRAKGNPKVNPDPYGEFLLQHIWDRAQFYDSLAKRVLKHRVRHTVLLHYNVLNALFLDQLIAMFTDKGWKTVDAERAYADPVYTLDPHIVPAGESLIWALAKEMGKFDDQLRYPGEDDVYENPKMDALKL